MNVFSDEEGAIAVQIARRVIEAAVLSENPGEIDIPKSFKDNGGVFTTINRYPSGDLRGCIGYSEPILPIVSAIVRTAKSAALKDTRFRPLHEDELKKITVSVSFLTKPEHILYDDPKELPGLVNIGKHGLIVKNERASGLLLPQVPVEQGWDSEVFLNQVCVKAGLPHKIWRSRKVDLYTFTAEVFEELMPNGKIVRKI